MIDPTQFVGWVSDFSSVQALGLVSTLAVTGFTGSVVLSRLGRKSETRHITRADDPFVVVYAARGPSQAAVVALSTLSAHGLVQPSAANGVFTVAPDAVAPSNLSTVENVVLKACTQSSQSVRSLVANSEFRQVVDGLDREATSAGLLQPKVSGGMRAVAALPYFAGSAFAGIYTYVGFGQPDYNPLLLVATFMCAVLGIRDVRKKQPVAKRQLISTRLSDHPDLMSVSSVDGKPSAKTYQDVRVSGIPLVVGLGGVTAAVNYCDYWSVPEQDSLIHAEQTAGTNAPSDALGSNESIVIGAEGSCGSGCGGGGCGGG